MFYTTSKFPVATRKLLSLFFTFQLRRNSEYISENHHNGKSRHILENKRKTLKMREENLPRSVSLYGLRRQPGFLKHVVNVMKEAHNIEHNAPTKSV